MIFFIAKRIAAIFNIDLQKAQKWTLIVAVVLGLILVVGLGLWLKSCFSKPAKLNEAEIQKGQQAIEQHNDEKLKEVLAAADAREQGIDANVARSDANVKVAVEEAKKKYDGMTNDELAAELEKRK